VRFDDEVLVTESALDLATGTVLWHVNQQMVVRDEGQHLLLHAAAAERDGFLVVLAGASGSGKSTTVAALVQRGFRYVTDEVVVLDRDSLRVEAFPRSVSLDPPAIRALGVHPSSASRRGKLHLPWWDLAAPGVGRGVPPSLIAFPTFAAGSATWTDVSPAEALLELAQHTFDFHRDPLANLASLARLVAGARAGRLTSGRLTDSCRILEGRLQRAADRAREHPAPSAMPRIERAQHATLVHVGDEAVARSDRDGSLHRLNSHALAVRRALAAGRPISDVAHALAAGQGVEGHEAVRRIRLLVEEMTWLGLDPNRSSGRPACSKA
jgi:hypothetical protein